MSCPVSLVAKSAPKIGFLVLRAFVCALVMLLVTDTSNAQQTFNLAADWVDGSPGSSFGQWDLGYHTDEPPAGSGSPGPYFLTSFPNAENPWQVLGPPWTNPGYDHDDNEAPPVHPADHNPGQARVNSLNANGGGLDLPEGTIVSRGRGGAYFTVPVNAMQVNVRFEGWNASGSFSSGFIARGSTYTDGDERGFNAFGGVWYTWFW